MRPGLLIWALSALPVVCAASNEGGAPLALPAVLGLEQAEAIALANQPRMLAAQLRARAAAEHARQSRAGYFPTVTFNATGAEVADTGTAIAAGNLPTSSISDRFAYGGALTQLVTDFGRTSALVGSARLAAEAQQDVATLTRAQVRLNLRQTFYRVLGAEAVFRAARAALANRQLVMRQVSSLAQSQIRSTLDVSFAHVLESEAELAVVRAESMVAQQRSSLATSMGLKSPVAVELGDVPAPAGALAADPLALLEQAEAHRADLGVARNEQQAAAEYARAEMRLSYPTLNLLAAAGEIPYHDHTLHNNYAAAGFNLSIPLFNGGLFSARRAEARLEANARSRDREALELQVGEEVRASWYRAHEAFLSLGVSARLVAQSQAALRLAQDRYETGLGSILELNEAQLSETSAEITDADSRYTYLIRRAELDFAAGLLN